jgi:peroxiredoxin
MKKILAAAVTAFLFSCNNNADKGQFTLSGELKSSPDQKIYLEQLYFNGKQIEVLDTAEIKDGKFTLLAIAPEEGLYRIRTADSADAFFISEGSKMSFTGTEVKHKPLKGIFSGSANSSLKKLMQYADSIKLLVTEKNAQLIALTDAGKKQTDSSFIAASGDLNLLFINFEKFVFTYADTAKSPVVSLFAPVEFGKLEAPLAKLSNRFPAHAGIADALVYARLQQVEPKTQNQPAGMPSVGDMAPEITMNDVDDKPFSLSQLRGKYVLIDFWASWCGPCRGENPNVVAAYNQYKDKNFTVLGVSLDKNKQAWLDAIKEDHLTWKQISDLKYWNSAAAPLYGFNGIPYNVLIDPQGKIIATSLRESALQNKLAEVLK